VIMPGTYGRDIADTNDESDIGNDSEDTFLFGSPGQWNDDGSGSTNSDIYDTRDEEQGR
jgi:hypothetical protein